MTPVAARSGESEPTEDDPLLLVLLLALMFIFGGGKNMPNIALFAPFAEWGVCGRECGCPDAERGEG